MKSTTKFPGSREKLSGCPRSFYNLIQVNFPDCAFRHVSRPARYAGGEWNTPLKDWDKAALRVALCYPDVYEVGTSNLALPVLYERLNTRADVLVERVFPPWEDMEHILRRSGRRLFSLESRHELCDFDVVAFSLGYELTYTNVLTVLDLGGVPLQRRERTNSHPLVLAGGGCATNPEPMSDFTDVFMVGEAEEGLDDLVEALLGHMNDRDATLTACAALEGIYVPSLYEPCYDANGSFSGLVPADGAAPTVFRRIAWTLPPPPTRPVVPFVEAVHDHASIEIQRGCTRGCRFCQAGMVCRPSRTRKREDVVAACEELTRNCGYSELSLLSLSTSDYPEIEGLLADLLPLCRRNNVTLSLPSLRAGPESVRLLEMLPGRKSSSFTFAPEAGTERLRRAINKNVTEEDVFATLEALLQGGWTKLKLYFMIGLPTETNDDVEGIADLVRRLARQPRLASLHTSVSLLVPKPHTPCQWDSQADEASVAAKVDILKRGLRSGKVRLSWPDYGASQVEAALSRGDRRVGAAILRAWQLGSRFDAWAECFSHERWRQAFAECGLSIEDYAGRARSFDEPLPWSHINTGVSLHYLRREHERMVSGEPTVDCRTEQCNVCGLEQQEFGCPGLPTGRG